MMTSTTNNTWWIQAGRKMAATVRDPRVIYFASGTNHPGEIQGLAHCSIHIGACVPDLVQGNSGMDALLALEHAAQLGALVFLDSGAFGEVDRNLAVVRPITDLEWRRRLAVYAELAARIGPALHFVCPDRVSDQAYTLELLTRYAPQITAIASTGARPLVAHQRGDLEIARFGELARAALSGIDIIPAIPMCRGATPPEHIEAFVRQVKPAQIHLLGMGVRSSGFEAVLAAVRRGCESTRVLCDSVLLSSIAARSGGSGGGPRMLTMSQDDVLTQATDVSRAEGVDGLDYTDLIGDPEIWMSKAAMKRVCDEAGLSSVERHEAMKDFNEWLGGEDERWCDPTIEAAIEHEWSKAYRKLSTRWRKTKAVTQLLGPQPTRV